MFKILFNQMLLVSEYESKSVIGEYKQLVKMFIKTLHLRYICWLISFKYHIDMSYLSNSIFMSKDGKLLTFMVKVVTPFGITPNVNSIVSFKVNLFSYKDKVVEYFNTGSDKIKCYHSSDDGLKIAIVKFSVAKQDWIIIIESVGFTSSLIGTKYLLKKSEHNGIEYFEDEEDNKDFSLLVKLSSIDDYNTDESTASIGDSFGTVNIFKYLNSYV